MAQTDVEATGRRVEALLDEITAAEPAASRAAEELVRELLALYGAGLGRLVDALAECAPERLAELSEEPLVSGLMALHDLHPSELSDRLAAALDTVRPLLASRAATVTVVELDGLTVQLRLDGSPSNGGGPSLDELRDSVVDAVHAAVPELERVDVAIPAADVGNGLIHPESLLVRPPGFP